MKFTGTGVVKVLVKELLDATYNNQLDTFHMYACLVRLFGALRIAYVVGRLSDVRESSGSRHCGLQTRGKLMIIAKEDEGIEQLMCQNTDETDEGKRRGLWEGKMRRRKRIKKTKQQLKESQKKRPRESSLSLIGSCFGSRTHPDPVTDGQMWSPDIKSPSAVSNPSPTKVLFYIYLVRRYEQATSST